MRRRTPGAGIVLLACVSALAGCHLVLGYGSTKADVPSVADRRGEHASPLDARGADVRIDRRSPGDLVTLLFDRTQPKPDAGKPKPDAAKPSPDTRTTYVDEDFTSGLGVVTGQSGTWSIANGSACQPSAAYNGYCATADVPVADYVAEAEVTVNAVKGVAGWAEGGGIGVRVQPGAIPPNPPGQYTCAICPDMNLLIVSKCPGGSDNNCPIQKSVSVTIPYKTPIVVRATISGNTLVCSLPAKGVSATYVDGSYTKGGVSLITYYADASFGYLKVYAP